MTWEMFVNSIGKFTWDFRTEYFIETSFGNWVWVKPSNIIRKFDGTKKQWLGYLPKGEEKGKNIIREFCGENVCIFGMVEGEMLTGKEIKTKESSPEEKQFWIDLHKEHIKNKTKKE